MITMNDDDDEENDGDEENDDDGRHNDRYDDYEVCRSRPQLATRP